MFVFATSPNYPLLLFALLVTAFSIFGVLFPCLRARQFWDETKGVITRIDGDHKMRFVYSVAEQEYIGTSNKDTSGLRVGQRIRVFYDPKDIERHFHHSWLSEFGFGWGFAGGGISMILAAI